MNIKVAVSNRHVHLTKEDMEALFGSNYELTKRNDLSQTNEFACNETVVLETPKSKIENVRVMGPCRSYTQVEISRTDAYKLGLNPPVRDSGDLENSEAITIIGPVGTIQKENSVIIARRHIHMNEEEADLLGLKDKDEVTAVINTSRGGKLSNVRIKTKETYNLEMHIDTDEANAFDIKNGDEIEIIK